MSKIKAAVITGFLGSGKTTLLNQLLKGSGGKRVAVIINEYGEVGIDGELIVETQDEIVELNNGCICCTVREDLVKALHQLLDSGLPFDRVLIETSGLADPGPVIQSFMLDETLAKRIELQGIVTLVDALNIERHRTHDEALEQIAFSDLLLITKTDLVSETRLAKIKADLGGLNPMAAIETIEHGSLLPEKVFDLAAFKLSNILSIDPNILEDHTHEHDDSIGFVAFTETEPFDHAALNRWLNVLVQEKGNDLFRIKGVLNLEDEARRYVFHGVHMTLEGRPGKPWLVGEDRISKLVMIGRNLDEATLREGFRSCRATPVLSSV